MDRIPGVYTRKPLHRRLLQQQRREEFVVQSVWKGRHMQRATGLPHALQENGAGAHRRDQPVAARVHGPARHAADGVGVVELRQWGRAELS